MQAIRRDPRAGPCPTDQAPGQDCVPRPEPWAGQRPGQWSLEVHWAQALLGEEHQHMGPRAGWASLALPPGPGGLEWSCTCCPGGPSPALRGSESLKGGNPGPRAQKVGFRGRQGPGAWRRGPATPPPGLQSCCPRSVRFAGGWARGPWWARPRHLRAFNMVIPLLSQLPANRPARPTSALFQSQGTGGAVNAPEAASEAVGCLGSAFPLSSGTGELGGQAGSRGGS